MISATPMETTVSKIMVAACVMNEKGELLLHTCRPFKSMCEEDAAEFFPNWQALLDLGFKVVPVEIVAL